MVERNEWVADGGRWWQSSEETYQSVVNVIDREVKLDHRRPGFPGGFKGRLA
jgi:hypothetical protein